MGVYGSSTRRAIGGLVAALFVIAVGPARASARAVGDTQVWATVPAPGQPAGIAVEDGRVYVSTLGLATSPAVDPRVFAFDPATGALDETHVIERMLPVTAMALAGLAADAEGRVYVADMNGRVVRLDPGTGAHEIYAEFPPSVGGLTTMPYDIAFGEDGTAYVSDQNVAGIWRVPAGGGAPEMWFQDLRTFGYLAGPTGIRLDPTGQYLYFSVASGNYPPNVRTGYIYRLPADDPSPEGLEEVFRYPSGALPFGIAFGASGKLYVTLAGPGQISILRPDGTEEKRFPSAEENAARAVPFDRPLGVAFDGAGSLLVTNSNMLSAPNPDRWVIFDIFVGDTAAQLAHPTIG